MHRLVRSRGSPPTADGGDSRSGGPMTLPFLKAARSRLSGPGVTNQKIGARSMATIVTTTI